MSDQLDDRNQLVSHAEKALEMADGDLHQAITMAMFRRPIVSAIGLTWPDVILAEAETIRERNAEENGPMSDIQ